MGDPSIPSRLLHWYDENKRSMPWRDDPSPYAVLMSELMLQQTRVETVIPYFERFQARWPTLEAFAEADEDDVLSEWAGLGYYSRAKNLLKAARIAVQTGGLPADVKALKALPGIGPYTAGAIASIAFGVATPVVDGNVERVLSRLDAMRGDPRSKENRKALWARAAELVPLDRPGDFNQSVMELGATVCLPRTPRCSACPLTVDCVGYAKGIAGQLPEKTPKMKPKPVQVHAGVAWWGGKILLAKRPDAGLLGSMWELPSFEVSGPENISTGLEGILGIPIAVGPTIGKVVHVFTHRKQTTVCHLIEGNWSEMGPVRWYSASRWIPEGELDTMGLPTQTKKTIQLVLEHRQKGVG